MEGIFDKKKDQLLLDSEARAMGPGLYRLNEAQKNNTIALPFDNLTSNINLSSTYLENDMRVDFDSDLKNLSRPLSRSSLIICSRKFSFEICGSELFIQIFYKVESSFKTFSPRALLNFIILSDNLESEIPKI